MDFRKMDSKTKIENQNKKEIKKSENEIKNLMSILEIEIQIEIRKWKKLFSNLEVELKSKNLNKSFWQEHLEFLKKYI
jgi:hypothetical protein